MPVIEITDIAAPKLDAYARLTEAQLKNRLHPERALFIAESPKVIGYALDAGYVPVSLLMERRHIGGKAAALIARCPDIPVYTADAEVLRGLTGYPLTRGVLCAMRRRPLPDPEALCQGARRVAVLENIVDTTNIGAIFRSAAALGVDAVLLTPSCCDPLNRRAVRVSMGTVFQVPWTRIGGDESGAGGKAGGRTCDVPGDGNSGRTAGRAHVEADSQAHDATDGGTPCDTGWPEAGLARLRAMGFRTAALALSDSAIDIDDPALARTPRLALVLGTEGDGLAPATIARCDYTVRIPMAHGVDSLNVAAAGAVAFWQLCR